jgi:hypothetical protein
VIVLAHNAAVMGLTVDFERLYKGHDPNYQCGLDITVNMIEASKRAANKNKGK